MRYLVSLLYMLCLACNNNGTTAATAAKDTLPATAPTDTTTCYAYQTSNDLVALSLHQTGQTVSGNLSYEFLGKDKNKGTITGSLKGDTLLADYTFMSEGKQSVRQVAFLRKGDTFTEGYGDAEQVGDKMVFKNTGTLKFSNMVLKSVPCNHP